MISCDTSALTAQLKQIKVDAENRMKKMVVTFSYYVTLALGENTPVGDFEALDIDGQYFNANYYAMYSAREDRTGLPIEVGYHSGAWQFSKSPNITGVPVIYEIEQAAQYARADAKSQYKLGDTFYIGASGPGYEDLERGSSPKAPDGIIRPTLDQIASIYSLNLANYYKGSV